MHFKGIEKFLFFIRFKYLKEAMDFKEIVLEQKSKKVREWLNLGMY